MSQHISKCFQKYYLILVLATISHILCECSTAKKVPDNEYLLTKNKLIFTDKSIYKDELTGYINQKPNKKTLFFFPVGLWFYNMSNPKYDTIFNEYMSYPYDMRHQKLRDSLFSKHGHPEYAEENTFLQRLLHNFAEPPVILNLHQTEKSAENIQKRLVFRGYWDAKVGYKPILNDSLKKAKVEYTITQNTPTYIKSYDYRIPDPEIRKIYENNFHKSHVKANNILDQTKMEKEITRLNDKMKEEGYYNFNASGQEIYFTADTLQSRKEVPVTIDIHRDNINDRYKKTTIGDIKVYVVNSMDDVEHTKKDSLWGINIYKLDNQYKTRTIWRSIILETGQIYRQRYFDLTKRNIAGTNNFRLLKDEIEYRKGSDSILDISYYLAPLPKYELKTAFDVNYSQILNFGVVPSVDITSRNLFGGAQNLTTTFSGTFGSIKSAKTDSRVLAYELSAQTNLNFPKLLLPFKYYKLIPKRYSPNSTINLGVSVQDNIGLGRINFNTGLNYFANVNDVVSHKLTLFNTQLNITRDKDKYYDFFPKEREVRDDMFRLYSPDLYRQFLAGKISSDDASEKILDDVGFRESLSRASEDLMNTFRQTLINKHRQTQDVIISSLMYNFIYNELGRKEVRNPFYFNAKLESAGNLLSFLSRKHQDEAVTFKNRQKLIFNIPYSQFIKFDLDIRKYLRFYEGKHTLALRQFIGLGIPYGNSTSMPIVRSYINGGANDIRAWRIFGGLGPSDSQLDEKVRAYTMGNMKLTTNIEYRMPFTNMFEGAAFVDAGNIWNVGKGHTINQFKFNKFIKQLGVGAGLGLRVNIAFITVRVDAAYRLYDPNKPTGERWVIRNWKPIQDAVLNFAFGYPF